MFLWRWKSSIIARNSIWNILFPDQSIKKGRRGRKREKETRKKPEKDEHYKENGLVKNTLSLVWNCEFKRSVFWMIVEYRMVFKQIGIIFPILWVQYKLGRKCVKRHPLFRLIICTLVKIAKEKKKPGLYSTDVRKRFQSVDHIGNIYGIITVGVHLICKPTHPAYWSNKVNVQNERVLYTQTEEKKHCVED